MNINFRRFEPKAFPATIGLLFLVSTIYFIFGWMSLKFATINGYASPVWIPSGLSILAALYFRKRALPFIFLGAFLTNLTVGLSLTNSLAIATGNTLEAFIGLLLISEMVRLRLFGNYFEFFSISLVAIVAPLFSATIGVGALYFQKVVPQSDFFYTWYTWWSGDAIGIMIILPLGYELLNRWPKFSWKTTFVCTLILVTMALITYLVYVENLNQAFSWLLCPFLIWTTIKVGSVAGRTTLIGISALIIYYTTLGYGPFEYGNLNLNLIYVQTILLSYSFSVLFIKPFENYRLGYKFFFGNVAGWLSIFGVIVLTTMLEKQHMINDLEKSTESAMAATLSDSRQLAILLQGGSSLFKLKPNLTSRDWKSYVDSLELTELYDGVVAFAYVKPVAKKSLLEFSREMSQVHSMQYGVKTIDPEFAQTSPEHYLVTYVEPIEANRIALGIDQASEFNRKEVADKSKELKTIWSSRPINLQTEKKPGFLVMNPIWDLNQQFLGWTMLPVNSDRFFANSLAPFNYLLRIKISSEKHMVFALGEPLKHRFKNPAFVLNKTIDIFGVRYNFEFYPSTFFFSRHTGFSSSLALILTLFMLFMSGYLLEQISFGERADALMQERSAELEESKIQLIQSSKMASLGEMASGMAHEINNPLTIIIGKVQVLYSMLEDLNVKDTQLFDQLGRIKLTTERIGKIVRGLKTFSRSSDQDPFEIVSLESIVEETLDLCSERFKANGVTLKIHSIPEIAIACRPSQIAQVLLNLFNNSNDALTGDGEKWIELKFELKENDLLIISLIDSGHGIPPEIADKIMQPFYTTKDVGKGTGLGLSIAKGIIEGHGGKLWLDQNYPFTRFVIELSTKIA